MRPEEVLSQMEFIYTVEVTGRAVAVHECGHVWVAVQNGIDFEFVTLNANPHAEQGSLLAELRLSAIGLNQIKSDSQLAMKLANGGPVAEFAFVSELNGGLPFDSYYSQASYTIGSWLSDISQGALTLFPDNKDVSGAALFKALKPEMEKLFDEFESQGAMAKIVLLADSLLSAQNQTLSYEEVVKLLSQN